MTETPNVTPNEIRNAKFSSSLRGIKRSEVEEFLNSSADALEDALSMAIDYRERFAHLQEKHEKLASIERTLKTTLLEAKKSASSLIASAKADAKDIISAAKDKQRAIENRAKERVDQMQVRIEKLNVLRVEYQNSLSEVIAAHLHTIKEMHVQSPEIDNSEEALAAINGDEITSVVEYEAEQPTNDEQDDEITKTWRAIQETDTDGPATAATLADTKNLADLFDESELDKYESSDDTNSETGSKESSESQSDSQSDDQKDHQPKTADGAVRFENDSEKEHETVVDRIARAVHSARSAASAASAASGVNVTAENYTTPVTTDDFMDEDTLYRKLAREHETERKIIAETAIKESASSSASKRDAAAVLPGPGPDGIMVFGRKEDRERSVEENVKVLQELDSVIDKFAEELEDVQRK